MFRFLPDSASQHGDSVIWVHDLITDLSVFFTVAIVGAMLWFAFKYRQRNGKDHETPRIEGSHFLEAVWTVVPTIVCIFLAYYGVTVYRDMREVPHDAHIIDVTAWQWRWDFSYENGKKTTGTAVIPVNKPVKFRMISGDVLHSFFIPSMYVKSDVIPKRYSYVTFNPVKSGEYNIFCTEYCGKDHSGMLARLKVVSEVEYARWLDEKPPTLAPAKLGEKLYKDKGCNACHSLNGARLVGPSWLKIFGTTREFNEGTSAVADENYLRESILYPNKHVVKGYPAAMPAFEGQLSDEEITGLISYIKSLDGTSAEVAPVEAPKASNEDLSKLPPAERGKRWFSDPRYNCNSCHSVDGSRQVGPTMKGIYGHDQEIENGPTVKVDDAFLTESIKAPMAKIAKGYPPAMPPLPVTDAEILDIIEYIKTLK